MGHAKKSDFEYFRNDRSIRPDYGTKHAPIEVRELPGQLNAEYNSAETVVGDISAADGRVPSTPESPTSGTSASSDEDWVLFQVGGIGLICHVILGYDPLIHTELLMCGLAHILNTDLVFGYMAYCEYNKQVSPQDGTSPGYDHSLDLDSRFQGEPLFNSCRQLSTLIGQAAVYADINAPSSDSVGLKGHFAHEHATRHVHIAKPGGHSSEDLRAQILL